MTLTSGDKAECKEIARSIIKEVMEGHIRSCPHGQLLARSKAWIIGVGLGIGLGGGVGGGSIVFALIHTLKGTG